MRRLGQALRLAFQWRQILEEDLATRRIDAAQVEAGGQKAVSAAEQEVAAALARNTALTSQVAAANVEAEKYRSQV